tara:strand:- start:1114 stop:1311 length:198 start_codon:yes stop_codon:yes gene_type:complete
MRLDPVLEFRNKVIDMRKKQVMYMYDKSRNNLIAAAQAEQEVDEMIEYQPRTDPDIRREHGANLA